MNKKNINLFELGNNFKFIEIASSYNPDKEVLDLIEKGWTKRSEEMVKQNRVFFNGSLINFEQIKGNIIYFSKSICYKDVVGLRYFDYEKYKNFKKNQVPNALSLYNIILTTDNKLFISKRDEGDWPVSSEVCGGFIRANESSDIVLSSINRVFDDLGLNKNNIEFQEMIGIYGYPMILETTIVFFIKLNLSSIQIQNIKNRKKCIFFENSKESILKILERDDIVKPSRRVLNFYLKLL